MAAAKTKTANDAAGLAQGRYWHRPSLTRRGEAPPPAQTPCQAVRSARPRASVTTPTLNFAVQHIRCKRQVDLSLRRFMGREPGGSLARTAGALSEPPQTERCLQEQCNRRRGSKKTRWLERSAQVQVQMRVCVGLRAKHKRKQLSNAVETTPRMTVHAAGRAGRRPA